MVTVRIRMLDSSIVTVQERVDDLADLLQTLQSDAAKIGRVLLRTNTLIVTEIQACVDVPEELPDALNTAMKEIEKFMDKNIGSLGQDIQDMNTSVRDTATLRAGLAYGYLVAVAVLSFFYLGLVYGALSQSSQAPAGEKLGHTLGMHQAFSMRNLRDADAESRGRRCRNQLACLATPITTLLVLTSWVVFGTIIGTLYFGADFCQAPREHLRQLAPGHTDAAVDVTYYLDCNGTNAILDQAKAGFVFAQLADVSAAAVNEEALVELCPGRGHMLLEVRDNLSLTIDTIEKTLLSVECEELNRLYTRAIERELCTEGPSNLEFAAIGLGLVASLALVTMLIFGKLMHSKAEDVKESVHELVHPVRDAVPALRRIFSANDVGVPGLTRMLSSSAVGYQEHKDADSVPGSEYEVKEETKHERLSPLPYEPPEGSI
ncbi:unnamed protein product [Chrysoparadoxa australica]